MWESASAFRPIASKYNRRTDGIELRLARPAAASTLLWTDRALEHLIDLPHRNAGIRSHRQQCRPGALHRFRARHAEKVPGGVFNVVRVHGTVGFELRPTVAVPARVIQRNAPLPELGRVVGRQLHHVVEFRGRLRHATGLKVRGGSVERTFGRRLRLSGTAECEHRPEDEN